MGNERDCKHLRLARSCSECADALEIAKLKEKLQRAVDVKEKALCRNKELSDSLDKVELEALKLKEENRVLRFQRDISVETIFMEMFSEVKAKNETKAHVEQLDREITEAVAKVKGE